MSKGLQLDGNKLTGDTYNMRQHIKDVWGGKWDAESKCWIVDGAKVIETVTEKSWGFCKVLEISNETIPAIEARKSDMQRGIWQRNDELTEDY
jgi:hypothetical protein